MFLKDILHISNLLACPICKSDLIIENTAYSCPVCNTSFPKMEIDNGVKNEKLTDFRIRKPDYVLSANDRLWTRVQQRYIQFEQHYIQGNKEEGYIQEINEEQDTYTHEFQLRGRILDVGGQQGRIRKYLDAESLEQFVVADPFPETFRNLAKLDAVLNAYPVIKEHPLYFLNCHAEHLPLKTGTFDWVHMHSSLDHFFDPYMALKEALRVLKPGGRILIMLYIAEGNPEVRKELAQKSMAQRAKDKFTSAGIKGIVASLAWRLKKKLPDEFKVKDDDHMFHLSSEQLKDLLISVGFIIEKEYWEKPPHNLRFFVCGRKQH
jgi:ubiquinone/menaquinone biosynthesis C-methylase UbiE